MRKRSEFSEEELEAAHERQEDLKAQIERCRELLKASRSWTGFEAAPGTRRDARLGIVTSRSCTTWRAFPLRGSW